MGAVKICVGKQTRTPYLIESTGNRIYSIEELAYYLYHNIYLADQRIMEEGLYLWIQEELRLPALAGKLRALHGMKNSVHQQVLLILKASEYYSGEEIEALSEKVRKLSGLQTQEKMKCRADDFMRNENYWAAVREYERILEISQNLRLSVGFYANVWNNLGGCYAKLFLFEKAAACFESAFQFQKYSEYKQKAHYARKLANYGQEESEELLESKLTKEFLKEAEAVLEELEIKSCHEMEELEGKKTELESFLRIREKQYGKISS